MQLSKTGYEHSDWRATGWSKSQETAIQLPDAEHYGHDRILKMDMYITTPCLGHGYILIWKLTKLKNAPENLIFKPI